MTVKNFFSRLFRADKKVICMNSYSNTAADVCTRAFAVFSVVEMAASLLSGIRYRTFQNGTEIKGHEWYSLNIRPNRNQSASQFWHEFWCKLLYNQEVLVVCTADGQKIIADDYNVDEYAVKGAVFSQVSRAGFTFLRTFDISEVFFLRYSDSNINHFTDSIFSMYDSLVSEIKNSCIRNSGERGILEVSTLAQGDKNFEERFKDLMNNRFKSYFDNKNAVLPLFNGYKYSRQQSQNNCSDGISDIRKLLDDALCRAAQIYKIPPVIVQGTAEGLSEAFDVMLTSCIDPLADMAGREMTAKEFTPDEVISGCCISADTSYIKHTDIFTIAPNADKAIASGFLSPNEVRVKAGEQPVNEEWANHHYITKNYQNAGLSEGGE